MGLNGGSLESLLGTIEKERKERRKGKGRFPENGLKFRNAYHLPLSLIKYQRSIAVPIPYLLPLSPFNYPNPQSFAPIPHQSPSIPQLWLNPYNLL